MEQNDSEYSSDIRARSGSSLASVAAALAYIALFSCFFAALSVPLAALSLILSLLSRGRDTQDPGPQRAIILAAAAIIASVCVTGYSFYRVYHEPALRQQVERMISFYYNTVFSGGYEKPEEDGISFDPSPGYESDGTFISIWGGDFV